MVKYRLAKTILKYSRQFKSSSDNDNNVIKNEDVLIKKQLNENGWLKRQLNEDECMERCG